MPVFTPIGEKDIEPPDSLYDWYARTGNREQTSEKEGNNGENERKKKNVKNSENLSKKKSLYSWYQGMRKTGKFSFD